MRERPVACLGQAWDAWAWSSFAALNWPALASSDAGNYPSGFVRGVPDTSKAFRTAASTDVSVWETFKEKRELFNPAALPGAWQQLTFDPKYAPEFSGGQIQMCASADAVKLERVKKHPRVFARLSKSPTTGSNNTGDETAEVASPAQESTDDLCAGFTSTTRPTRDFCEKTLYPPQVPGQISVPYTASGPNGRNPVGPRVFKGSPAQDHFLYYEVKVNYDYYAYVAQPITVNGQTTSLNTYATRGGSGVAEPHRASRPHQRRGGAGQTTLGCWAIAPPKPQPLYQSLNQAPGSKPIDTLPGLGSIQLKAAWVPSKLLDGDPNTYHLTDAVYYKDSPSQPNGLCYDVEQFGLIGLHIIQRVHAGAPGGPPEPAGGTYIFATWEHQSIGNGAGYTYVNYSKFATNTELPFPNTAAGLPVARLKPYPLPTTQALDIQVQADLPNSVWKNYRLIGTQFKAMDVGDANAEQISTALGQPLYLANLVIETNRGLQQFQGQPPGQTPNSNFAGHRKCRRTSSSSRRTDPNMIVLRQCRQHGRLHGLPRRRPNPGLRLQLRPPGRQQGHRARHRHIDCHPTGGATYGFISLNTLRLAVQEKPQIEVNAEHVEHGSYLSCKIISGMNTIASV